MSPRDQIRSAFPKPESTLGSGIPIPDQRIAWEKFVAAGPAPPPVTITPAPDGISGLLISPPVAVEGRLIIHVHGGGFVMGSSRTHLPVGARLASAARSRVLLVDYRLAPEHPFPAALDDVGGAYRWALAHGYPATRIVLSADSAGGHIAMTALLQRRSIPSPAALVLISPWLDLAQRGESMRTRADRDPLVLEQDLHDCARLYLGELSPLDVTVNPLDGDLAQLPPILVHVGDDEILLSDSMRLAERVRATGGSVELVVWPRLWHVFHAWAPQLPEADEAIAGIAAFIERRVER